MGKAAFGKTEMATEHRKLLRPIRGKAITPRRAKGAHRDKPPEQWISIDVPAIVSRDVFDAAQATTRAQQAALAAERARRAIPASGADVCSRCGYAFYGKTVSSPPRRASDALRLLPLRRGAPIRFAGGRVCSNQQVRVDQLDDYVWQSVCELLQNPARMLDEWSRRQKCDGIPTELRERRDEAARELAIHERGLKRLVDAYEVGAIELKELKVRSEVARARIEQSEARRRRCGSKASRDSPPARRGHAARGLRDACPKGTRRHLLARTASHHPHAGREN